MTEDEIQQFISRQIEAMERAQAEAQKTIEAEIRTASESIVAHLKELIAESKAIGTAVQSLRNEPKHRGDILWHAVDLQTANRGQPHVGGGGGVGGMLRPVAIGKCENLTDDPIIPGEFASVGEVYIHKCRFDAMDKVYDTRQIAAGVCARSQMPNATPGEIFHRDGQRLMITEIKQDMVFFETVDPEPSEDDPEG